MLSFAHRNQVKIVSLFPRSEKKGFISNCKERKRKKGGSIKIKGVCPSRIEARILIDGQVSTDFIETHVGHEDEVRSKRLKKIEELQIVDRLKEGVPNNRILQDAREIADEKLTRMNVLTPQDLMNIKFKHKIDKHKDDMAATSSKIQVFRCRSNTVNEDTRLLINEPTTSGIEYQEDVKYFIEESTVKLESSRSFNCFDENPSDEELIRKIKLLNKAKRKELNRWLIACTEGHGEI